MLYMNIIMYKNKSVIPTLNVILKGLDENEMK